MDLGHDVYVTKCTGQLSRCVGTDAISLDPSDLQTKAALCQQCEVVCGKVTQHLSIPTLELKEVYTPQLKAQVQTLIEDHETDLLSVSYDGISFGQLAFADLCYAHKIYTPERLNEEQHLHWRIQLESCLLTYIGMRALIEKHGITHVVTYGQYAINLSASLAARESGIYWRTLQHVGHRGIDRRRFFVQPECTTRQRFKLLNDSWPLWTDIPATPDEIDEGISDILTRMGGNNTIVYSPNKSQTTDLRTELAIPEKNKVVVAFTSSLDEKIAQDYLEDIFPLEGMNFSQPDAFETQVDWVTYLKELAEAEPSYSIIIRIHPREDSNARENTRSEHLTKLTKALADPPPNCIVVWPKEKISSYDLAEIADLVLTSFSNIALECARMGIPVATYFQMNTAHPIGDFIQFYQNPEELKSLIEKVCSSNAQSNDLRLALRYYRLRFLRSVLDYSDIVDDPNHSTFVSYRRPEKLHLNAHALLTDLSPDKFWRQKYDQEFHVESREIRAESEALLKQIGRLMLFLMFGIDHATGTRWSISNKVQGVENNSSTAPLPKLVVDSSHQCQASLGPHQSCRRSRAVARLAEIYLDVEEQLTATSGHPLRRTYQVEQQQTG